MSRRPGGTQAKFADGMLKHEKSKAEAAQNVRKPSIERPIDPVTEWFVLQSTYGPIKSFIKVVCQGTKKACLSYIVTFQRENPLDESELFLAHGLKIAGY